MSCALLLFSCAAPAPVSEAPAPAEIEAIVAPEKPALTLPPPPSGRTEEDLWALALRRSESIKPLVAEDIAEVRPEPIPAAVLKSVEPEEAAEVERPPAPPAAVERPVEVRRGVTPAVQVVETYTVDKGLPSNRITALYVDEQDAWVGTADAGVARLNFAEGNWIVTRVEDGLASNRVSDIVKFRDRVFVGTQEGVSIWDGVSWTTEAAVNRVKLVNTLFRVQDDLLWVAARTMHGGLLTYDGAQWSNKSTIKPGTLLNNVSDFAFSDGELWIGTTNRGVYNFDGRSWSTFTVAQGISSNFVYTLGVRGKNCYLGGCCGVSAYEGGTWSIYDIAEGLPHSTVNVIAVDGNLVWFGSKKGLGLFNGFEFTNFYMRQGLTDDRITSVFVRGNDVWVGTANGLNRLEKSY